MCLARLEAMVSTVLYELWKTVIGIDLEDISKTLDSRVGKFAHEQIVIFLCLDHICIRHMLRLASFRFSMGCSLVALFLVPVVPWRLVALWITRLGRCST